MVKELRESTGAGMMDAKKALTEVNGDMEAAVDWLRTKGLAKAAKKADRVAAEGLVGVAVAGGKGVAVEVNSETDFVGKNADFQNLVRDITKVALGVGDVDALKGASVNGKTVEAALTDAIATIGENMSLRRSATLSVQEGIVASYVHNQTAPGLGKIGVLAALSSKGDAAKLTEFGRQLCMHISFAAPKALTEKELDPALIERERKVFIEQAIESGKSEEIAKKMVEGRMRKEFYQQVVLMEQTFMGPGSDGKARVADVVKAAEKTVGAPVTLEGYLRFALGEGIDKKADDFAAEVQKLAQGG